MKQITDYILVNGQITFSEELKTAKIHAVNARGKVITKPSGDPSHVLYDHYGGEFKIAVWIDGDEVSRITVIKRDGSSATCLCKRTSDTIIEIEF